MENATPITPSSPAPRKKSSASSTLSPLSPSPNKDNRRSSIVSQVRNSSPLRSSSPLRREREREKERDRDPTTPSPDRSITKVNSAPNLSPLSLGALFDKENNINNSTTNTNTNTNTANTTTTSNNTNNNKESENVRVVCRFRPDTEEEKGCGGNFITFLPDNKTLTAEVGNQIYDFKFDKVFPSPTTQEMMYNDVAQPLIDDVLNGFNAAIIAYGQTGTGKTYTMQGYGFDNLPKMVDPINSTDKSLWGIVPRMLTEVFSRIDQIQTDTNQTVQYSVKASIIEIYLEKVKDLLTIVKNPLQLRIKEGQSWLPDATEVPVSATDEVLRLLKMGTQNRMVADNKMNVSSSRSHLIFIAYIQRKDLIAKTTKTSQLYLVDLAGSEKVSKTSPDGLRLKEAQVINKSLLSLGLVINALASGKGHIPYRDSKLTWLLQNSLGGNSKTCLIVNCSTNSFNDRETLSALLFGERTQRIQNKPSVNVERTLEEVNMLLEEALKEKERQAKYIRLLEDKAELLENENCKLQNELKMISEFREQWDTTQSLLSTIQGNNKEIQRENTEIKDLNYKLMSSRDSFSWMHIIFTILLFIGVAALMYCSWMQSCCSRLSLYVAACGFLLAGVNIYRIQSVKVAPKIVRSASSKLNDILVV